MGFSSIKAFSYANHMGNMRQEQLMESSLEDNLDANLMHKTGMQLSAIK